ncbi:hypothetical protein [Burkholderia mayonis]|uniref:hypothetical protein n=1 Tax=Burkholderia mayonis TaxID=1385591 RepID=UPI000A4C9660|nr:hypothetical protein [Burkholderia mayonis]
MKLNKRWIACLTYLMLSLAHAQPPAGCVTPQRHAESEGKVSAMTQNFDVQELGRNLTSAGQERSGALDAVKKCQSDAVPGMGCGREINLYNLADEAYRNAAQALEVYRTLVAAQANARAMEAPVCR